MDVLLGDSWAYLLRIYAFGYHDDRQLRYTHYGLGQH